jgi:hypothetical protein
MLPGTGENGCLETLLLKAPRNGGPNTACLDAWIQCSGFPAHHANNLDKFRLRSILAASIQSEPNISIQRMWTKADNPIDPADPAFKWIADDLQKVFS